VEARRAGLMVQGAEKFECGRGRVREGSKSNKKRRKRE